MNWLGKVFVVVILIMSLVFLGLSMAIYATHTNWREVVEGPRGLRAQLAEAQRENEHLRTQHNRRVEELAAEIEAAEQQVRKLETERVALADRNVQMQTELDQLREKEREHIQAVASTQKLNEDLASQVNELRQQIRSEQQARDRDFATALAATEQLHQILGEYEAALERSQQLSQQVANMTHVMRESGIDPATEPGAVVPIVEGLVRQVRRYAGDQLVEITIGSDDGLREGNMLEVSRGGRYLGRIEVLQTTPDRSVGRVDRRFQQGQIQEGDRVQTNLSVGMR